HVLDPLRVPDVDELAAPVGIALRALPHRGRALVLRQRQVAERLHTLLGQVRELGAGVEVRLQHHARVPGELGEPPVAVVEADRAGHDGRPFSAYQANVDRTPSSSVTAGSYPVSARSRPRSGQRRATEPGGAGSGAT